jgi:hypothetical protein
VLTPLAHRVDILLRALEPRTHAPVGLIADPASEVPPLGLLLAAHTEEDTLYAAVHGNFASYHVQCGHRPIMLFRPNVRTAIRADVPMTARCASATNPVAPGTASVIPPSKTQAAVIDETLAHA